MNYFSNPYMPGSYTPFAQGYNAQQNQSVQVVRVNGRPGAEAYTIGPNSSALLLDESGTMVWLCTTDGAGYKSVSAYDITPHQTAPAPDFGALENRIKRLEDFVNEYSTDSSAAAGNKDAKPSADQEHVGYGTLRK